MSFEARAINRIGTAAQPARVPSPAERLNLARRISIADRLINSRGTRLGLILADREANSQSLADLIREVLTFSPTKHEVTSELIDRIVLEVEALPQDELMRQAQDVVSRLYAAKVEPFGGAVKTEFPTCPTVAQFAQYKPNGHFDPFQYFFSGSWGTVNAALDYGKDVGYDRALKMFKPALLRDALVFTYAFESLRA